MEEKWDNIWGNEIWKTKLTKYINENILGCPKMSFGFFCTILWKNSSDFLANPVFWSSTKYERRSHVGEGQATRQEWGQFGNQQRHTCTCRLGTGGTRESTSGNWYTPPTWQHGSKGQELRSRNQEPRAWELRQMSNFVESGQRGCRWGHCWGSRTFRVEWKRRGRQGDINHLPGLW